MVGLRNVAGVRARERQALETMALLVKHPEKLQELLREREARHAMKERAVRRVMRARPSERRARLETKEIIVPVTEWLRPEEASQLVEAAKRGDFVAQQRLRTAFYPLAISVATRVATATPARRRGGRTLGDMAQLAWGVIDWGITHYDPAREPSFRTYLSGRMFGQLLDELRSRTGNVIHVPRGAVAKASAYERAHRAARRGEIAPEFERDRKKRLGGVRALAGLRMVSVDDPLRSRSHQSKKGEDTRELSETIAGRIPSPLANLEAREVSGPLRHAMDRLDDKQRAVMALYYFAGTANQPLVDHLLSPAYRRLAAERGIDLDRHHNMKEIGAFLVLTESRIAQIHGHALEFLKEKLAPKG